MTLPIKIDTSNGLFAAINDIYPNEEKPDPLVKFQCDPLALVLYWKNEKVSLPNNLNGEYTSDVVSALMYSNVLEFTNSQIPEKYKELATKIREYYNNKYSYGLLMGDHISDTQKAIAALATNTSDIIQRDTIPLLVSLQRFYDEDVKIEKAMNDFISVDEKSIDDMDRYPTPQQTLANLGYRHHQLTFHSLQRRKTMKNTSANHDFWFKNHDGNLVRYQLPAHTQEAYLLNKLISANDDKLEIAGTTLVKKLFNNNFYHYTIIGRIDIE